MLKFGCSSNNIDKKANPFEKSRVIKKIVIHNELDSVIKVSARVQKERLNIKNIQIKKEYELRNEHNNEQKDNIFKKQLDSNDVENLSQQNRSKATAKHQNRCITTHSQSQTKNDSKSQISNDDTKENFNSKTVNIDANGSYGNSQQNAATNSNYNRDKKGGGGSVGYGPFSASANYEQEKEQQNSNASDNMSKKDVSCSVNVGYESKSHNKQQQKSNESDEKIANIESVNDTNDQNISYVNDKDELNSYVKSKGDVVMNLEQNQNSSNKHHKDNKIKSEFEAHVNYTNNPIDQQPESEVIIEPKSMTVICRTVNDETSLIDLTILYKNENNEWAIYCKNLGFTSGEYVFDKNIKGAVNFHILSREVANKIFASNNAKISTKIAQEKVAANNKRIMNNDWEDDDVADYIMYLSRKYGAEIIDPSVAGLLESAEISGSILYKMKKKELKDVIKDKGATKKIYNELIKLRYGELPLPSHDELNYKPIITEWDAETVKMFVSVIYDGKYYDRYTNAFETTTGEYLINKVTNESILKSQYGITDYLDRHEIWQKIDAIRHDQNVPEKIDIMKQFKQFEEKNCIEETKIDERVERAHLKGYVKVEQLDSIDINEPHRTIMVIGETGNGKTTLINSMMNYLWDVRYPEVYRYYLIDDEKKTHDQSLSQTEDVTAYRINPPMLGYQLTIIDTPGYGDTRGIDHDRIITYKIKNCFAKDVQSIDAICFVIRAPQARLTSSQKYIFSEMLGIFGKDIKDNILICLTFADGQVAPALAAIQKNNIPFRQSFRLNNSGFNLNKQDDNDGFSEMFWNLGMRSFGKLFDELNTVQPVALTLTNLVLDYRQNLELNVEQIQKQINVGYSVLDGIRAEIAQVEKYGHLVEANKDFLVKTKVHRAREVPNGGACTTTCLECNYTCHKNCHIENDNNKDECYAMTDGFCGYCPNHCHWSLHKNTNYTVEWYSDFVEKPIKELKRKYYNAKKAQSAKDQIINGLKEDLSNVSQDLYYLLTVVRICISELHKIALRPNVLSQNDYIDQLIQSEVLEKKKGWKQRCDSLREIKEKYEIVKEINEEDFFPWENYYDVAQYLQKQEHKNVRKIKNCCSNEKQKQKALMQFQKEKSGQDHGCNLLWFMRFPH